jgi:hypothetical protein
MKRLWGLPLVVGIILGLFLGTLQLVSQERHTMISRAHSDSDPDSPGTAQLGDILVATGTPARWNFLRAGADGRVLQIVSGVPAYSATSFPTSAGPTGTILRSDGTNWVATTATYPNTVTANRVLYATSTNVVSTSAAPQLDRIGLGVAAHTLKPIIARFALALGSIEDGLLIQNTSTDYTNSGMAVGWENTNIAPGGVVFARVTGQTNSTASEPRIHLQAIENAGVMRTVASIGMSGTNRIFDFVGRITRYNNALLTDGQLLIGSSSDGAMNAATITGTTNQVNVVNGNSSITLSTPQNIHTSATPQFDRLGLGVAAPATSGMFQLTGVTFASLGTPANGTFAYCSDCTIANPCAGGGTGAFAKRLNGAWVCN